MMTPISLLRIETQTSPAIRVRDSQLYLRSQVVRLRLPVPNGGLIWNRPVSVVVRTPGGQEQILFVPDVTRTAIIGLLVLNLVGVFLFLLFRRKNA